ncbi:Hypothetical predicted protein [Olea europaea subsp. europaea]|uniref:Uncharacterized protein n=1 Tax=Olea europaea subsp. europaea TaxID=158383 RepID=A0A8S0V3P8_OLEEU|nr:Hypothetical predicted protein [Olea europaea subsp. europaea]
MGKKANNNNGGRLPNGARKLPNQTPNQVEACKLKAGTTGHKHIVPPKSVAKDGQHIDGGSSQLAKNSQIIATNSNKATAGQNIAGGSCQSAVDGQNTAENSNKAIIEQACLLEATTSGADPTGQEDTSGQVDANEKPGASIDQNEEDNPFIEVGRKNKPMNATKGSMPKRITPQPITSDRVHVQKSGVGIGSPNFNNTDEWGRGEGSGGVVEEEGKEGNRELPGTGELGQQIGAGLGGRGEWRSFARL